MTNRLLAISEFEKRLGRRIIEAANQVYGKVENCTASKPVCNGFTSDGKLEMNGKMPEVGKVYSVNHGTHKAYVTTILTPDAATVQPVLGYIVSNDGVFCCQTAWTLYGVHNRKDWNLDKEWVDPLKGEHWINVYTDYRGELWLGATTDDKDKAVQWSIEELTKRNKTIARIKINWTEGQFDE